MLWLKTSGRAPSTVAAPPPRRRGSRASAPRPSASAASRLSARIVAAKWPAPRSGTSSRSTDVTTTCFSPICAAAWASRSGSSGSGGVLGLAGVDVAVAAGAGAGVAEDLEGRRAAAPALADVRAARLLADRVQARAVDQLADVEVARVRARRAHLHPLGAARPLGDGKRRSPCAGQSESAVAVPPYHRPCDTCARRRRSGALAPLLRDVLRLRPGSVRSAQTGRCCSTMPPGSAWRCARSPSRSCCHRSSTSAPSGERGRRAPLPRPDRVRPAAGSWTGGTSATTSASSCEQDGTWSKSLGTSGS